jgi:hypothetical protein
MNPVSCGQIIFVQNKNMVGTYLLAIKILSKRGLRSEEKTLALGTVFGQKLTRERKGERTQLSGVPISLLLPCGYSQDSRPDSDRLRANAYKRCVQSLFEHGSSRMDRRRQNGMEQSGNVKF